MLETVLPDLQKTERACWWMGRALRARIHLGVYILQQMFNLTDRAAELVLYKAFRDSYVLSTKSVDKTVGRVLKTVGVSF